ncbi:MAG: hypothetical protein A2V88_17955 [Elusimicrobia bacterium RBG_16_66_12]|nr:MAG: hypothetical protein A2V88_17955 [Elusimicrobia bacterium RBG_16_66_12]
MNIERKFQLSGLAGVLFMAAALAQATPQTASSKPKQEDASQAVADESSQNIWDSDIERVGREIRKLQRKLQAKEREGRALEAYKKGDYDAVRAMVPDILKLDPEAIDAAEYLAAADWQKGDRKKALAGYDRAIENRKKWLEKHLDPEEQRDGVKHLSVLYGNRGVARLMEDPKGAIEDFDEALKNKTPLTAMIMWEKSEALSALHQYADAAKLFAAAVEKDPNLKQRGNVKFPDPTARNLCQVLAANGQNISACN